MIWLAPVLITKLVLLVLVTKHDGYKGICSGCIVDSALVVEYLSRIFQTSDDDIEDENDSHRSRSGDCC